MYKLNPFTGDVVPVGDTAGGGGSIATGAVGWCSQTGNDGTAVLGDPAHPYATAQAAVDGGAHVLVLTPRNDGGDYGTVNYPFSSPQTLSLVGYDAAFCRLNTINAGNGGVIELRGNGKGMVGLNYIYAPANAGATVLTVQDIQVSNGIYVLGASSAFDGQPGEAGGTLVVYACDLHGAGLAAYGGNGKDATDDGMGTPADGTAGGNGGSITAWWCRTDGASASAGHGIGGAAANGGTPGSDGSDGSAAISAANFNTQ